MIGSTAEVRVGKGGFWCAMGFGCKDKDKNLIRRFTLIHTAAALLHSTSVFQLVP
jgi:hypothetical protein